MMGNIYPFSNIRACSRCRQTFDLSEFMKGEGENVVISSYCKDCNRSYANNLAWKKAGIINEEGKVFTTADYKRLALLQDNKCKICNISGIKLKKALAVDHDHKTGFFRGLLCSPCNLRIGGREH